MNIEQRVTPAEDYFIGSPSKIKSSVFDRKLVSGMHLAYQKINLFKFHKEAEILKERLKKYNDDLFIAYRFILIYIDLLKILHFLCISLADNHISNLSIHLQKYFKILFKSGK